MKRAILLFFFTSLFSAQDIQQDSLQVYLSTLASDKMKGRLIGTQENEVAANYIATVFKKNKLDFCIGNSYLIPFDFQGKIVYNVCGIKKGTNDSIVAFGAHLDHIGTKEFGDDTIYNGADDDASGVTMVLALSDYFKQKTNLLYTTMYITYNGEESGMLGSTALCEHTDFQDYLKKMLVEFNFEMLGTISEKGENRMFMTGDELSNLDEIFNTNSVNNFQIFADPYKNENLFYRSDNVNFYKKGVVAHSFSTVDMNNATHYHHVNDDISVINFTNLTLLANNFAKTLEKVWSSYFKPKYGTNDYVKVNNNSSEIQFPDVPKFDDKRISQYFTEMISIFLEYKEFAKKKDIQSIDLHGNKLQKLNKKYDIDSIEKTASKNDKTNIKLYMSQLHDFIFKYFY